MQFAPARLALFTLTLCAPNFAGAQSSTRGAGPPRHNIAASTVSAAMLAELDFIIGRFRVVGRGGLAHLRDSFEEYRAVDDSTVVMRGYRDSTFSQPVGEAVLQVRAGRLQMGTFVASAISRDSVRLEATVGDDQPMVWRRGNATHWTIRREPRPGEAPGHWEMQRIP